MYTYTTVEHTYIMITYDQLHIVYTQHHYMHNLLLEHNKYSKLVFYQQQHHV